MLPYPCTIVTIIWLQIFWFSLYTPEFIMLLYRTLDVKNVIMVFIFEPITGPKCSPIDLMLFFYSSLFWCRYFHKYRKKKSNVYRMDRFEYTGCLVLLAPLRRSNKKDHRAHQKLILKLISIQMMWHGHGYVRIIFYGWIKGWRREVTFIQIVT